MKHRKGLSEADRQARSQLHQLLERADGLVHGSLIRMARRCGNPNCRCALKNQKHESWCLGVSEKGRTRMKHVPRAQVQQYRQARQLLETISQEAWKQLQKPQE
jgi:hypothetical protein